MESAFMPEAARRRKIEKPVYVCGLARAGTTLLLEALYCTGAFAAHTFRSYPYIDIPLIWHRWTALTHPAGGAAQQRGHLDLLDVTADSPEALEEMIWMAFFPELHNPAVSQVPDPARRYAAFDGYYTDHIRKLMHAARRTRYMAKGNYNLTRIGYLRALFPDARFVVPVRRAESHIASLMKQHYLFTALERRDPRVLHYMNRVGHFEFGLNRTPVNGGDVAATKAVLDAWATGDELRGWALYWNAMHRFIHDYKSDPHVHIVLYDDLCVEPERHLRRMMEFCGTDWTAEVENLSATIRPPSYYTADFSTAERGLIKSITAETEAQFYGV
jgi:hypothetical protein